MFELRVRRDYGSRGKDRNFMFVSRNGAVGCEDDKPEIAWFELWRGKIAIAFHINLLHKLL